MKIYISDWNKTNENSIEIFLTVWIGRHTSRYLPSKHNLFDYFYLNNIRTF
jgi:hypothetical protein